MGPEQRDIARTAPAETEIFADENMTGVESSFEQIRDEPVRRHRREFGIETCAGDDVHAQRASVLELFPQG